MEAYEVEVVLAAQVNKRYNLNKFCQVYKQYLFNIFIRNNFKIKEEIMQSPTDILGNIDECPPISMQPPFDYEEEYTPINTKIINDYLDELYDEHPELKNVKSEFAWIQTYSGKRFYPLEPTVESICIEDIAHALSMQCRFTGHSLFHYSVAQHSVLVSYLCDSADRLQALLHDASEAYISDISSIIKKFDELAGYRKIEDKIQTAIYEKYNVDTVMAASVKSADILLLGVEAETLMSPLLPNWHIAVKKLPVLIKELSPKEAKELFLERFNELYGK